MSQHKRIIKATIEYYLPDGVLKNIFARNFLQTVIKASMAEFTFNKLPCFQHVLVKIFRRMYPSMKIILVEESFFLRLKQHSVSCLKLKKPHCKNIRQTIKAGVYSFKSSDSGPFSKNRNYTQNLFDAKQSSAYTNI